MHVDETPYVLWLTENYYPNSGGMAQSCDRIVQGLRDAGINIGLIHFRTSKSSQKFRLVKNGFYLRFPVIEDAGHCFNMLYNFLTRPELKLNIKKIVAFGGYLPILGAPILSQLFNIELITLLRGNDFDLSIFTPKRREMLFYSLNQSKTVCTVCSEQAFKLGKLLNHKDIRFIPNGIVLNEWVAHKSELEFATQWKLEHNSDNKRIIGLFGHLKPKKGIEFFLSAIIRSQYQDKILLLLTGEIYPEVADKLNFSGIQHQVLPFMERNELLRWYHACDAVAIPSFYDGMPNVLLEAGALGIPVIAAKVGGIKDVIKNEDFGFLFHPGDEEACTIAIKNFVNSDHEFIVNKAQALKQLIEFQYNSKVETSNYLEIVQE